MRCSAVYVSSRTKLRSQAKTTTGKHPCERFCIFTSGSSKSRAFPPETSQHRHRVADVQPQSRDYIGAIAGESRSTWQGSPCRGWRSSPSFSAALTTELHRVWSEPLRVTRKSALDLIQCAAGFSRFAAKWHQELEHEFDYWDAAKWGWRAFRAWATCGVSELIKLGVGLLKSSRDQEAWEKFAIKLTGAIDTTKTATHLLDKARVTQKEVALRLADGLHSHLIALLASDYSRLDPELRQGFIQRISRVEHQMKTDAADSETHLPRQPLRTLGLIVLVGVVLVMVVSVAYLRFVAFP